MLSDVPEMSAAAPFQPLFSHAQQDFASRYAAAMESVAAFDRCHLGRIRVSGGDRESFLHNMLSADIRNLVVDAGTSGAFLTQKGKLVSDLAIFKEAEHLLLEMEAIRVPALLPALSRYVISEDVSLENLDDEASFSLEGPNASESLASRLELGAAELDAQPHLAVRTVDSIRVTARHREPSPRFDISGPITDVRELLEGALEGGVPTADIRVAETRRIEAGRPRFGIDMDETHLPLEAALDDAISFDKGCYIGQEYVVRLAHRGTLNRKLCGIRFDGRDVPSSGAAVTSNGEPAGNLTSAAFSPRLDAVVALGYLRKQFFAVDTELALDDGSRGVVSAIPFTER